MTYMKTLLAGAAACLTIASASQAAILTYDVHARFEGDWPLELIRPDGTVCYDTSCMPTGYRLPPELGGIWYSLRFGDAITARFTFEDYAPGTMPKSSTCSIAGYTGCDDLLAFGEIGSKAGSVTAEFYQIAPTSSVFLDLPGMQLSYEGEAGSYAPGGCTAKDPVYSGLPTGFCDFSGYRAEFTVTSYQATLSVVPLSSAVVFLLSGVGALAAMTKRRRRPRG